MLLPPSRQPSRHKNLWGNFNRKCDSRVKMICYCHGLLTFLALIYIPIWLLNRTTLINIAGSSENLLKYFIMLVHSFAIKVSSRPLQRWDNTRSGTTMTSEVKTTSWPELPEQVFPSNTISLASQHCNCQMCTTIFLCQINEWGSKILITG